MSQRKVESMGMASWMTGDLCELALRLSFRAVVGCLAVVAPASIGSVACGDEASQHLGEITGRVSLIGKSPLAKVADSTGEHRPLLELSRRGRGIRYVVLFLEPRQRQPSHPSLEDQSPLITIDQVDHVFQPHLVAIQSEQRIRFTNSDAANHNVRSVAFESDNQFNVFTGGGQEYVHRFVAGKSGRPVGLECNLHPWMKAWVYVFEHSWFAVTDHHGSYRIAKIPFGEYDLRLVQPDVNLRRSQKIVVRSHKPLTVDIEVQAEDLKNPAP